MAITSEIETIILEDVVPESRLTAIDFDLSLINGQILDSLALLRLVSLVEAQFDVTVGDGELIPENFETINNIGKFIEAKRQGR